jgi:hypothetical protein
VISITNIDEHVTLSGPTTDVEVINGWYLVPSKFNVKASLFKTIGLDTVILFCLVFIKLVIVVWKLLSLLIANAISLRVFKFVGAESTKLNIASVRFVLVAYADKFILIILVTLLKLNGKTANIFG